MYDKVPQDPLEDEYQVKVETKGAQKTVEDLLELAGTNGCRNYLVLILCTSVLFLLPMHLVTYEFLGDTPNHRCHIPELNYWTDEEILNYAIPQDNITGKYSSCTMYNLDYNKAARMGYKKSISTVNRTSEIIKCSQRYFQDKTVNSIVTEWDLVCDSRWLYSSTQSATMVGVLVGSLLCGYLVDAHGRKKMIVLASPLYLITGISCALAPNITTYIFLKTILAFIGVVFSLAPITLGLELCSAQQRSYVGSWSAFPWALGYISVAGITYLVRPWRTLQAALTAPVLLHLPNYWLLPESPRWLITHGHYEDAIKVLRTIAVSNGKTLPSNDRLIGIMHRIYMDNRDQNALEITTSRGFKDLVSSAFKEYTTIIRKPKYRTRTLTLSMTFFTSALVYYGISLSSSRYSSNKYLYVFINGVLEIPAYLVLGPIIAIFGRRRSLSMFFILCGAIILTAMGYLLAVPQEEDSSETLLMILNLIGKFAITCAFTIIFVYTNELYPTRYRSMALGQANALGRIGSISSPFINDLLGEVSSWAPSAVFGLSSLITGCVSLLLPETGNKNLQEVVS